MTETLAVIRQQLATIDDATDPRLRIWKADQRVGVQRLLQQWERTQKSQQTLQQHYERMTERERAIWAAGIPYVAGIDEVGRGPLAGPVVAAAVILPHDMPILPIDDSKKLRAAKREALYDAIMAHAVAVGVASCTPEEIDALNIYQATKKAMHAAVAQLVPQPQHLLVDAMTLELPIAQESLIKGDARSYSIAAASIVAKVVRNRMMAQWAQQYPAYEWDKNAGYGTAAHLAALRQFGVTPLHRKSFEPIKSMLAP